MKIHDANMFQLRLGERYNISLLLCHYAIKNSCNFWVLILKYRAAAIKNAKNMISKKKFLFCCCTFSQLFQKI